MTTKRPSLDPPDEIVIAALVEYLRDHYHHPVEAMAAAAGLSVKELFERYLPTALN